MVHSVDLSACHFIQDVAPSSTSKLIKKIKGAIKDADIKDDIDLDTLDNHFFNAGFGGKDDGSGDADEMADLIEKAFTLDGSGDAVEIADSIGKALSLAKQVEVYQ